MDSFESVGVVNHLASQRVNRLRYLDEYACCLKIIKTEPDSVSSNGRNPCCVFVRKMLSLFY